MVADALVYHPSVAHYLRFVATTRKSLINLLLFNKQRISHKQNSRQRQSPPHNPILRPLLLLVPLPHQQPNLRHRALGRHQKTIRPHPQNPTLRQIRRTHQSRLRRL